MTFVFTSRLSSESKCKINVVRHVGLSTSCLSSNTVRNNMSLLLTIIANMLTERNMTFVFTSRLSSESKCKINVVRHVGLSTSCLSSNTVRNNMSLLLTIIANMLTERI